jgi:hypothetical protein
MNQSQLDAMYIIELFVRQHIADVDQRRALFDAVADFLEQPEIVKELNAQREVQS